ncbi:MAG: hypothetical protein Kow0068_16060 [Marinilabiliales bacterium]
MKYKLNILLSLLLLSYTQVLLSQDFINSRVKARYILSFAKFLDWQNEDKLDNFTIATFGKDTSMYIRLSNLCKNKSVRNKPIIVKHIYKIKEISNVQIVYVEKGRCDDIKKIYKQITGKNILLVTDGCEGSRETMLNFLPLIYVRLEINQPNMEKEGFKVPSFLAAFAAKYEQDYKELLSLTEDSLKKEKETVNKQKEILENQAKEIAEKEHKIKYLNDTLEYQLSLISVRENELKEFAEKIEQQKIELKEKINLISKQEKRINEQLAYIAEYEKEISQQKSKMIEQKEILDKQKQEIIEQQEKINLQKSSLGKALEQIEKQKLITWFIIIALILIFCVLVMVYINFRNKKKANKKLAFQNMHIKQQNEEIEAQRDEIEAQRDMVSAQKQQLEELYKEMTDSIEYAKRIQQAILSPVILLKQKLSDVFILYKPRDIVSGDFYWFAEVEEKLVIAVADCTGHGVPGAFMSMLGLSLLRDIVVKEYITHSGVILRRLRKEIIKQLNQSPDKETKDGMDISLCVLDLKDLSMQFSGANNPIYIVRSKANPEINEGKVAITSSEKNNLYEIKGDKMPIALYDKMDPFNVTCQVSQGCL